MWDLLLKSFHGSSSKDIISDVSYDVVIGLETQIQDYLSNNSEMFSKIANSFEAKAHFKPKENFLTNIDLFVYDNQTKLWYNPAKI